MLKQRVLEFIIAFIAFLAIDAVWIIGYAGGQYKTFHKKITGREMTIMPIPAVVCYFLLALALVVLLPFVRNKSAIDAFKLGALAGFIIYGVYDTTTMAIFGQPYVRIGVMDWAWGTLAMGLGLAVTARIVRSIPSLRP